MSCFLGVLSHCSFYSQCLSVFFQPRKKWQVVYSNGELSAAATIFLTPPLWTMHLTAVRSGSNGNVSQIHLGTGDVEIF